MKLKDYLAENKLTQLAFAERAGVNVSMVNRALHGKVVPRPETMQAIYKATNGAVTANDFHEGMAA